MSQRDQGDIDRGWNVWKQAAEILNVERQLWRDAPFADELQEVVSALLRIGYLPANRRAAIIGLIASTEQ